MQFSIELKKTKRMGYGVFACKNFKTNQIIEICPVLPVPKKDLKLIRRSIVDFWFFEWQEPEDSALIFGYGMLYNHSFTPNAKYLFDFKKKLVTFISIKSIKKNEEIFIDYNQNGIHQSDKKIHMLNKQGQQISIKLPASNH